VVKARTRMPPRRLNKVPLNVLTVTLRELGMLALYTRSSWLRVRGTKLCDMESESALIDVFRHSELCLSIAGLLGCYRKPYCRTFRSTPEWSATRKQPARTNFCLDDPGET